MESNDSTEIADRGETSDISSLPSGGGWAVDAMSASWENLLGYVFPSLPILGRVIRKA